MAVNSSTAATHLALEELGPRAGDVVLTKRPTFVATAEVVRYRGAALSFVDADLVTRNIAPAGLAETCATIAYRALERGRSWSMIPVRRGGGKVLIVNRSENLTCCRPL